MAAVTATDNRAVVEAGAAPGIDGMTVVAEIIRDDVLRVFARCATVVVALPAFQRCAFELAAYVAAGTVNLFVLAGKWEAGREMVETNGFSARVMRGDEKQD